MLSLDRPNTSSSMKHTLSLFSSLALTGAATAQTILINEIDPDTADTGDASEFVELVSVDANGTPIGNQPLDGLVLVFFNGNSGGDAEYNIIELSGQTSESGLYVLGDAAVSNADAELPGSLQNGTDGIGLFMGTAEDFVDADATSTNPVTGSIIIDAIVYGRDGFGGVPAGDDADLRAALAPEGVTLDFFNESGNGGVSANLALARIPDGGSAFGTTFVAQNPSPGLLNIPSNAFSLSLGATSVSESVGSI